MYISHFRPIEQKSEKNLEESKMSDHYRIENELKTNVKRILNEFKKNKSPNRTWKVNESKEKSPNKNWKK